MPRGAHHAAHDNASNGCRYRPASSSANGQTDARAMAAAVLFKHKFVQTAWTTHHAKEPGLVPPWPLHLRCAIAGGMRVQEGGVSSHQDRKD